MGEPEAGLREGLADRYTLERELGRGGMATVYLAQDLRHDRPVALKVLHPELAASLGPAASSARSASPPGSSIRTSSRCSTPARPAAGSGSPCRSALLKTPYSLSPGWLRIDPNFESLRGNPRFQKLVAGAP